jgi:ribosomal RNA assembly protein
MVIESVSIPEDRKAVLIGNLGKTKRNVEKHTKTKIRIGDTIEVEGESLDVYVAMKVIKAIGRGFSPPKALFLVNEEYDIEIISMQGENDNTIKRLFARVIGTEGMTRRKLEQKTHTCISIYGKTVSIIGKPEDIFVASESIRAILTGAPHYVAYKIAEEKHV